MKLTVICRCGTQQTQFDMACGTGENTFKWLALAAAQRFALQVPHGELRRREATRGASEHTQYTPSNVFSETCPLYHPDALIKEYVQDGSTLTVELSRKMPVASDRTPQISRWAVLAFHTSDHKEHRRNAALQQELAYQAAVEDAAGEAEALWVSKQLQRKAGFMKQIMHSQMLDDKKIAVEVVEDWTFIRLNRPVQSDRELDRIKTLVMKHYSQILDCFRFVSAAGDDEHTSTLDFKEFADFAHELELFHGIIGNWTEKLRQIFIASSDSPRATNTQGIDLNRGQFLAALIRLAVVRFIDVFEFQTWQMHDARHNMLSTFLSDTVHVPTPSKAFQHLIAGVLIPVIERKHLGSAVKNILLSDEALTVLYDNHPYLSAAFQKYCTREGDFNMSLDLSDFARLLTDCGLLELNAPSPRQESDRLNALTASSASGPGGGTPSQPRGRGLEKTDGIDELTVQEARRAFAMSQSKFNVGKQESETKQERVHSIQADMAQEIRSQQEPLRELAERTISLANVDDDTDETMTYAEFLESLAWVGAFKWEDSRISMFEKIVFAVDAVTSLAKTNSSTEGWNINQLQPLDDDSVDEDETSPTMRAFGSSDRDDRK